MKFTRRDRRDVRFFLWFSLSACLISAYFGYAVAPVPAPPQLPQPPLRSAFHGALTSLMIATPIALFELRIRRPGFLCDGCGGCRWWLISLKVLFYTVVIITGLLVMRPSIDAVFRTSLVFSTLGRPSMALRRKPRPCLRERSPR